MSDDLTARIEKLEKQLALAETYSVSSFWTALDRAYAASLPDRDLACLVCGHSGKPADFEILADTCQFGGGHLERYRCPQCDCVFGPQKYLDLDEAFVDLDYRLLYSRYSESDSSASEIRTFHAMTPRQDGVYLDWGCGGAWSPTIETLRAEGWDVWGYEPSAELSSDFVAHTREGITATFDGIFSNNVIEHFRDPVAQFEEFHTLLKPGGMMAHSSPCYEYSYPFTRFHTFFPIGRSVERLAERTGFRVVETVSDGEYRSAIFERI